MRTVNILIFCIFSLSMYSQTNKESSIDGTYLFEKAVFTISNSNSKSEVNTRVITDPAIIDTTDLFLQNIFLQTTISNGILSFCILPDQLEYRVEDGVILIPTKEKPQVNTSENNHSQLPHYLLSLSDDKLTFTFIYLYGDSKYHFPLEGKLVVTLTKQK